MKFEGKQMKKDQIILREITQIQKDKLDMYSIISVY